MSLGLLHMSVNQRYIQGISKRMLHLIYGGRFFSYHCPCQILFLFWIARSVSTESTSLLPALKIKFIITVTKFTNQLSPNRQQDNLPRSCLLLALLLLLQLSRLTAFAMACLFLLLLLLLLRPCCQYTFFIYEWLPRGIQIFHATVFHYEHFCMNTNDRFSRKVLYGLTVLSVFCKKKM